MIISQIRQMKSLQMAAGLLAEHQQANQHEPGRHRAHQADSGLNMRLKS
jgi:hypothetical protein